MNDKANDAQEIYDLLLSKLKETLANNPDVAAMKLALEFVKVYGINEDLKVKTRQVDDFIGKLPFKVA